jgi:hypothetical protein
MGAVDPQALEEVDLLAVLADELGDVADLEDSDVSDLTVLGLEPELELVASSHDIALACL